MNTAHLSVGVSYTSGYAKGRNAAREQVPLTGNPYRPGSPAYHGWNDGHYDERSARRLAIERHNGSIWSTVGAN